MTTLGIDYAWGRPQPAHIAAAGYSFVLRYLSTDPGKNLTASEAKSLLAAGLDIGVVWETTANRALSGALGGAADGAAARRQTEGAGAPLGSAIYFAVDFDAQPGQLATIDSYADAFATAVAPHPAGVYGGLAVCNRLIRLPYRWQTAAWSRGWRAAGACLFQRIGQVKVDGVGCDVNEQLGPFGGWRASPIPTIQEARVALNAPICDIAVRPDGTGYWLLAEDFGVFSFGNVGYMGHPNDGDPTHGQSGGKPIGIVSSPSGNGYLIAASDGGVFTFGDAQFHGVP